MSIQFDENKSKTEQEILDLFSVAFKADLSSPIINDQIQAIKHDLFEREYLKAFDDSERNRFYVCRWSPSRALAYTAIFSNFRSVYHDLILKSLTEETDKEGSKELNFLQVGAGAGGEYVALMAILTRIWENETADLNLQQRTRVLIDIVDIADYKSSLHDIQEYITNTWVSGETKAMIEKQNADKNVKSFMNYFKQDILKDQKNISFGNYDFITLLFTTNELFQENKLQSVKLLQRLNMHCKKDCLLLIVELAGSFSHIDIGKKTFPVHFLIDMILCKKNNDWELVEFDDSCWYRVQKDVFYELKLENMRFFYRLYRKL